MAKKKGSSAEKELSKKTKDFVEELEGLGQRFEGYVDAKTGKKRPGNRIEKGAKDFAEEVEEIADRVGRRTRGRGDALAFIFPLISSLLAIVVLVLSALLIDWVNRGAGSHFLWVLSEFILSNLHWIFVSLLFFGYKDFFEARLGKGYLLISPVMSGIGASIVFWFASVMTGFVAAFSGNRAFAVISGLLSDSILDIFLIIVVIGYVIVILKILFGRR